MGQNDRRSPTMNPAFLPRALTAGLLALAMAALAPARAQTLDKVSFGTNWVAEAEHGGFFQAVADGTYKKYGLDVTIVPGGPNTNNRMLLIAGKLDFFMSANTLQSFDAVTNKVPLVDGRRHLPEGSAGLPDPPGSQDHQARRSQAADAVGVEGRRRELLPVAEVRIWLQREQGEALHLQPAALHREQAERDAGLCHLRALRRREGRGLQARTSILLADYGFNAYSTLIETRREIVDKKPDLVQRFVDASVDRLVQLSLRRQQAGQCDDQEAQPGNDRRVARLFASPR